jgi:hypothetical protein
MSEPADPVTYAAEKCLEYAARFDLPALAAADFIGLLKLDRALSDNEIAEVARRVIEKLGERASRARFPDDGGST